MTPADDLNSLHGQHVGVEQVDVTEDVTEDVDGIPSWIKVERDTATVVIVPSLLGPPTPHPDSGDPAPQSHRGAVP